MVNRVIRNIFFALALLSAVSRAWGSAYVIESDLDQPLKITGVEVFRSTAPISIGKIVASKDLDFQSTDLRTLGSETNLNGYWLKFSLRFHSEVDTRIKKRIYLKVLYEPYANFTAWIVNGSGNIISSSDDRIDSSFNSRDTVYSRDTVLPFEMSNGDTNDIYLKIETHRNKVFTVELLDPLDYATDFSYYELCYGLFFGFILSLIIYNLIIYISIRELSYLLYVIYAFVALLWTAGVSGIGGLYLWPKVSGLSSSIVAVNGFAAVAALCFFARNFIELHKHSPRFDQVLKQLIYANLLSAIYITRATDQWLIALMSLSAFIAVLFVGVCAVYCWRRGSRTAGFYLLSFLGLLISAVVYVLQVYEIISPNIFNKNGLLLGIASETLLLSIGLSDRIKEERRKKLETQLDIYHFQQLELEEKHKIEKNLEKSEQLYRFLYESSQDCYFETNPEGVITEANKATVVFLGFPQTADLIQSQFSLFTDLPQSREMNQQLAEKRKNQAFRNHEIRLELNTQPKKTTRWGLLSIKPIRHENIILGYRCSIRNITERKEKEQVLLEKETAEAVTQKKSALLATISHEIRTPLTTIIGYAELLYAKRLNDQDVQKSVHIINRSGRALLAVIENIITLSKNVTEEMATIPHKLKTTHKTGLLNSNSSNEDVAQLKKNVVPKSPRFVGSVLLAEDSSDHQQLIQYYLEKTGLEVFVVEDGETAIESVVAKSVHLILMDNHMPKLSGIEAVAMLRKLGITQPVIGLITSRHNDEQHNFVTAGADECLVKPIDYVELYALLNSYFTNTEMLPIS